MPLEVITLTRPSQALRALRELTAWASELHLAYAWASSGRGSADHWLALPHEKLKRVTLGIHFVQTEPQILRTLARLPGVLKVVEDAAGVFHPKVIVGVRGGEARALIGSSNFTKGGFSGNTELNVLLQGSSSDTALAEVLEFVEAQWSGPRGFTPDPEWLTRYELAYASRPVPPRLPSSWGQTAVIRDWRDLDVAWDEYFALITIQERRTLANNAEIHVFDHPEGSYLEEAEHCRDVFQRIPEFARIPSEERKLLSGWGKLSSGYFGRMTGAGYFKQLVGDHPEAIATFLDTIPMKGPVSQGIAERYLTGMLELRGVSLATATRLLCVKRPDRFLPFNGANKRRIREIFGSVAETIPAYLDLHDRIWDFRWVDAPTPADPTQRRVWSARVALLDALLYEAPSASSPPPGRTAEIAEWEEAAPR